MPGLADILRTQIDYTIWASGRLVRAAAQLSADELNRDFGTADRSVLGTLVHIFAADRTWLGRIEGKPPLFFVQDSDYFLSVLETEWPSLHARWKSWAASLSEHSAESAFTYVDMQGRQWTQPLWQTIFHVVNHGSHHRGQVAGFLRSLGHPPPKIDLAVYCREI